MKYQVLLLSLHGNQTTLSDFSLTNAFFKIKGHNYILAVKETATFWEIC